MKKLLIYTIIICVLLIIVSCNKDNENNSQSESSSDSYFSEASSSESEVQESSFSEISETFSSSFIDEKLPLDSELEELQIEFTQIINKIITDDNIDSMELATSRYVGINLDEYSLSTKSKYIINSWRELLKKADFKTVFMAYGPPTGGAAYSLKFHNVAGETFAINGIFPKEIYPYNYIKNNDKRIEVVNYIELREEWELLERYMGYPLPHIDAEGNIDD